MLSVLASLTAITSLLLDYRREGYAMAGGTVAVT